MEIVIKEVVLKLPGSSCTVTMSQAAEIADVVMKLRDHEIIGQNITPAQGSWYWRYPVDLWKNRLLKRKANLTNGTLTITETIKD